jgi:hypothetical protein
MEYLVDAAQRSMLFRDVMRQRGNQYREHLAKTVPHVLDYEPKLVIDVRSLPRPVNYLLVPDRTAGGRCAHFPGIRPLLSLDRAAVRNARSMTRGPVRAREREPHDEMACLAV